MTVDISTEDINEVKKNINRSMQEQDLRYRSTTNIGDKSDARRRFREMEELAEEIASMGEVIKIVDIRIFLSDYTVAGLEEKIKDVMAILEGDDYKATIYLNESKREWKSMYQSYTEQQNEKFAVFGQALTSQAVAGGEPFHFSDLNDPNGTYFGQTPCGGVVNLDIFTRTLKRLHYNGLIIGKMRSGKSTTLKKLLEDRAIRGDFIRAFDITGEFEDVTREYNGKFQQMDGTDGILNPLEILPAGDNERVNFIMHLSKLKTLYAFLNPDADNEETTEFVSIMGEIYAEFGIDPENRVTGIPSVQYPIFSDVLNYIEKSMDKMKDKDYSGMEEVIAKNNILVLERIRKTVKNIVSVYGAILDGYTSIDNITDEPIVVFNLSTVKEMASNIFDAVLFNLLSLCWGNCVTNGMVMKDNWEMEKVQWEDIVRFIILCDESHRWINVNKPQALDIIGIYMREAPKYFGSIIMASQSIRDYFPEGSGELRADAVEKLKTLFELTQYKFIFHQDSSAIKLLRNVFENVLTEAQLKKIPLLEQGETILCISGDRNIEFKVYLSPEEDKIFRGGA